MHKFVESYHVVERRDGVSFVGNLSVREYLGEQVAPEDDGPIAEEEDEKVETES